MFAFLATNKAHDDSRMTNSVARFARDNGLLESDVQTLSLDSFRIDLIDTNSELHFFESDTHLILLSGTLLNREFIEPEAGIASDSDAELVLALFERGTEALSKIDGHVSFIVFDAVEKTARNVSQS